MENNIRKSKGLTKEDYRVALYNLPRVKVFEDLYVPTGDTTLLADFICEVNTHLFVIKYTDKEEESVEFFDGDPKNIENLNPKLYSEILCAQIKRNLGKYNIKVTPIVIHGGEFSEYKDVFGMVACNLFQIVEENRKEIKVISAQAMFAVDTFLNKLDLNKPYYKEFYR